MSESIRSTIMHIRSCTHDFAVKTTEHAATEYRQPTLLYLIKVAALDVPNSLTTRPVCGVEISDRPAT